MAACFRRQRVRHFCSARALRPHHMAREGDDDELRRATGFRPPPSRCRRRFLRVLLHVMVFLVWDRCVEHPRRSGCCCSGRFHSRRHQFNHQWMRQMARYSEQICQSARPGSAASSVHARCQLRYWRQFDLPSAPPAPRACPSRGSCRRHSNAAGSASPSWLDLLHLEPGHQRLQLQHRRVLCDSNQQRRRRRRRGPTPGAPSQVHRMHRRICARLNVRWSRGRGTRR